MRLGFLKIYYFLISFSVGAFQFVNLYYVQFGMSTAQIGILFAVGPCVMIFAQPLWGLITDYMDRPKLSLVIMTLGSAVTALFFPLSTEFWHLFLLNVIYFFFQSSIQPVADGTALSILEDRRDFGRIRLWGSLGYAIGVASLGKILDIAGLSYMFVIFSMILMVALVTVFLLPVSSGGRKSFRVRDAVSLLNNRAFILFLCFSFLIHLTVHANNSFFAIHLENLGGSVTLVGIALMVKSILEIPFFALSKKLMERYSFLILLTVVGVVYAVRWLIVGGSENLQILVASQVLLSISFSIQYFVSASYVDSITPVQYRVTGQTFFWGVTFGLGGLTGNILAGWALNFMEIDTMYLVATVIALASIAFLWIGPKNGRTNESVMNNK